MTITRAARAAGWTAAVLGAGAFGAVATPAQAALAAPAVWNIGQAELAATAPTDDVWIQYCREVTAIDISVFRNPTGDAFDILERGDKVDVIGPERNGKLPVNYKEDGQQRSGWVWNNPDWIGRCD